MTPVAQSTQETVLHNADVIEMVAGGLPEEVIVARIGASHCEFDVSTRGLVELNRAHVPAPVMKAMIGARTGGTVHAVAPSERPSERVTAESDPALPSEPGIYLYARQGGVRRLTELEPTTYSASKTGGFLKRSLTYGLAKSKTKAQIRGLHASIVVSDPAAVFYFVFPPATNGGAMAATFVAAPTSPNEFTLVHLDVTSHGRETTIAAENDLGTQLGTDDKANVPFTFSKLRAGVYRVTPSSALEPGEYCFLSAVSWGAALAGTAGASRLFDFSVTSEPSSIR